MDQRAGVDLARTCTHTQTIGGGEAHRGVERLAELDSGDRCAVTNVAGYDARLLNVQTNHISRSLSYELVACAVETILADLLLGVVFIGNSVEIVVCGNSLVECGVESEYLRNVGQDLGHRQCALQVCGVVQRSHLDAVAYLLDSIGSNECATAEMFATVSYTMTYGVDLVVRADNAINGIDQCFEDQVDTHVVISDGLVEFESLFAYGFVFQVTLCLTDTIDQTLGQQFVACIVHIDHLIFDRRTTAIQYKNVHCFNVILFC